MNFFNSSINKKLKVLKNEESKEYEWIAIKILMLEIIFLMLKILGLSLTFVSILNKKNKKPLFIFIYLIFLSYSFVIIDYQKLFFDLYFYQEKNYNNMFLYFKNKFLESKGLNNSSYDSKNVSIYQSNLKNNNNFMKNHNKHDSKKSLLFSFKNTTSHNHLKEFKNFENNEFHENFMKSDFYKLLIKLSIFNKIDKYSDDIPEGIIDLLFDFQSKIFDLKNKMQDHNITLANKKVENYEKTTKNLIKNSKGSDIKNNHHAYNIVQNTKSNLTNFVSEKLNMNKKGYELSNNSIKNLKNSTLLNNLNRSLDKSNQKLVYFESKIDNNFNNVNLNIVSPKYKNNEDFREELHEYTKTEKNPNNIIERLKTEKKKLSNLLDTDELSLLDLKFSMSFQIIYFHYYTTNLRIHIFY